jgi:hypothetical protein
MMPIYISRSGPLPRGQATFYPVNKVRVWFQDDISGAGVKINTTASIDGADTFNSNSYDVSFTPKNNSITIHYDSTGQWGLGPL